MDICRKDIGRYDRQKKAYVVAGSGSSCQEENGMNSWCRMIEVSLFQPVISMRQSKQTVSFLR
jgi:hypothetical protein